MPNDAELVELEARRAELREKYLRPPEDRPTTTGRGIHHAALICSDVEATIRFYQDLLGFPLVELVETVITRGRRTSSSTSATRRCSASSTSRDSASSRASSRSAASSTSRSPARGTAGRRLQKRLDEAGVKYAGPDQGIPESMYFKDPDGIQIELLSDPLMYFGGHQLDE